MLTYMTNRTDGIVSTNLRSWHGVVGPSTTLRQAKHRQCIGHLKDRGGGIVEPTNKVPRKAPTDRCGFFPWLSRIVLIVRQADYPGPEVLSSVNRLIQGDDRNIVEVTVADALVVLVKLHVFHGEIMTGVVGEAVVHADTDVDVCEVFCEVPGPMLHKPRG